MEKTITIDKLLKQINLSIGPSSVEECLCWDSDQKEYCIKQYISVFKQLERDYSDYKFYLVSFLLLGFPENKMKQRMQEKFEIRKFYQDHDIVFSDIISEKILNGGEEVPRVVSVASIGGNLFNAFFLESEYCIRNYLIMTRNNSMEDLLDKARRCKCDGFFLSLDDEFIKEIDKDVIISFFDVGVDGNSITIHYNRFCPSICGVSSDKIERLQNTLDMSESESMEYVLK